MPLSPALADTFNRCAGKIMNEDELGDIFLATLNTLLTATGMTDRYHDEQFAASYALWEDNVPVLHKALDAEFFDKSRGSYQTEHASDPRLADALFVDATYFQLMFKYIPNPFSEKIVAVIETAYATAIDQAHDYREDIQAGKLKLKPARELL